MNVFVFVINWPSVLCSKWHDDSIGKTIWYKLLQERHLISFCQLYQEHNQNLVKWITSYNSFRIIPACFCICTSLALSLIPAEVYGTKRMIWFLYQSVLILLLMSSSSLLPLRSKVNAWRWCHKLWHQAPGDFFCAVDIVTTASVCLAVRTLY